MKNCLGYTNIHIYCVESLRFGAISFKELQKYFKYGGAFAAGLSGGKVCCSAHWRWSSSWNYSRYKLFEQFFMFVRVGFRNLRKFLNLQNEFTQKWKCCHLLKFHWSDQLWWIQISPALHLFSNTVCHSNILHGIASEKVHLFGAFIWSTIQQRSMSEMLMQFKQISIVILKCNLFLWL